MVSRLGAEGTDFASGALKKIRRMSPTSVKVSLEAIRRHQATPLKEALVTEYRMSQWCMRPQPHSDFCEGIRAVLVDKDHRPQWDPPRLEDVPKASVEGFFMPL